MLAPRALNTTKNPINFCSTYLSPVPKERRVSTIKDAISAMKKVLLMVDKVDRAGKVLTEISSELRDHDRRLIRLETMVEIAKNQPRLTAEPK